jgi:hypothetical protein
MDTKVMAQMFVSPGGDRGCKLEGKAH